MTIERLGAGAEAKDFALIGFEDFELQAVVIEFFTGLRNVSRELIEQSGDGSGRRFDVALPFHAKKVFQFFDADAAAQDHAAVALADHIGRGMAILFPDIADDFLD